MDVKPITVDVKTACQLFTQWTPRNIRKRVHDGTFPIPFVDSGGRKWFWYLKDLEQFATLQTVQVASPSAIKNI
jgi:hypothetical protein